MSISEKAGSVTNSCTLQEQAESLTQRALDEALDLVTRAFLGNEGRFIYEAFDWINHTLHHNLLPRPLIIWNITKYGHCLGLTEVATARPPLI